jgi:hypothetical protein
MLGRTGVVEAGIRVFWVLQGCPSRAGTWAGSALSVPLLEWHPAQLSVGSRQFAITVDHAG